MMEDRVQRSIGERGLSPTPSVPLPGFSSPLPPWAFSRRMPLELTDLVCRAHGHLLLLCGCWRGGGGGSPGIRGGARNATLGGEASSGQWALGCPGEGCSLKFWGQEDREVLFRGAGPWRLIEQFMNSPYKVLPRTYEPG